MKKSRNLTALLLCLAFAAVLGFTGRAAADEPYTYTVRIFAGAQATFEDGSDVVVMDGLHYGDRITVDLSGMQLPEGSRYYVKGVRESGLDNSEIGKRSFTVTRDADYVVGYGVLYRAVAYTVNYRDAAGNTLAESRTFYGNPGDKPVIAHRYIDGYQPQAYNLTRTLSEDPAANVFDFVYEKADPVQVVRGTGEGGSGSGGSAAGDGGQAGQAGQVGQSGQAGQPAGEGSAASAPAGEGSAASGSVRERGNGVIVLAAPAAAPGVQYVTPDGRIITPAEVLDLDAPGQGQAAPQTPLAPAPASRRTAGPRPWVIGAAAGGSALLAGGIILAVCLKRKKKES